MLICKYCGKECKNANSLRTHEILCKKNPNHQDSPFAKFNKIRAETTGAWNKGLTKETNEAVKRQAQSLSKSTKGRPGRKHTEEEKQKISNSRKAYLSANPDKVPYLLNHSSKESFPETYFKELFIAEGIHLTYHHQINKYELDFCDLEKKIDIEIDGEQHYVDKRIVKSDIDRNNYLIELGWQVYRIRWSEYKKMTFVDKEKIINEIKLLLS